MDDEKIMREIDDYVEANGLKKIPIDKSFPIIAEYAKSIDEKYGNDRSLEELLNMYTSWLSVWCKSK
jgi:hypothetical protein